MEWYEWIGIILFLSFCFLVIVTSFKGELLKVLFTICVIAFPVVVWIVLPSLLPNGYENLYFFIYPITVLYFAPFWYKWEKPQISKQRYYIYVLLVFLFVLALFIGVVTYD